MFKYRLLYVQFDVEFCVVLWPVYIHVGYNMCKISACVRTTAENSSFKVNFEMVQISSAAELKLVVIEDQRSIVLIYTQNASVSYWYGLCFTDVRLMVLIIQLLSHT